MDRSSIDRPVTRPYESAAAVILDAQENRNAVDKIHSLNSDPR